MPTISHSPGCNRAYVPALMPEISCRLPFDHVRKRGVRWYFGAVGPIVTGLLIFVYFAKPFGSSRTDNQRNFLFCLGFGMDTNFCFAAFVDRYMVLSKKIT